MNKSTEDAHAWFSASQHELSILREDGATSSQARLLEGIPAMFARIHRRYSENFNLPLDQQLPLAVFERLVEMLTQVAADAASPALYRVLRDIPDESFGKKEVLATIRTHLLAALSERLNDAPDDTETRLTRGQLYLDDDDPDSARRDFADILKIDSHHAAARREQARLALLERNDEAALQQLNALLDQHPADAYGLLERARLWLRFYYLPEALADLEHLVHVAKDEEALLFASKQLLYVGRAREAAEIAQRIPDNAEALLVLGKAQLDLADAEAASSSLDRALKATIGKEALQRFAAAKVNSLKLLGDSWIRLSDTGRALACYLEAMASGGPTYELRRALAKTSWDHVQKGGEPPTGALQALYESARLIEPNMEMSVIHGGLLEVRSADLQLAPYLERLPWTTVVGRLEIGVGRRDNREALAQLFQLELPQLHSLDIEAEHFGFPCLYRLVAAPFFTQLLSLRLQNCDLDCPSLQLLLERIPHGLVELRVLSADARAKLPRKIQLDEVIRQCNATSLEVLELSSCELSTEEVIALTEAQLPSLRTLVLTGNDLGALDISQFLDSPLVKQLHELRIGDSGAERDLLLAILEKIDELSLKRVWAQRSWSEEELATIRAHPGAARLELELGVSEMSEESWLALLG